MRATPPHRQRVFMQQRRSGSSCNNAHCSRSPGFLGARSGSSPGCQRPRRHSRSSRPGTPPTPESTYNSAAIPPVLPCCLHIQRRWHRMVRCTWDRAEDPAAEQAPQERGPRRRPGPQLKCVYSNRRRAGISRIWELTSSIHGRAHDRTDGGILPCPDRRAAQGHRGDPHRWGERPVRARAGGRRVRLLHALRLIRTAHGGDRGQAGPYTMAGICFCASSMFTICGAETRSRIERDQPLHPVYVCLGKAIHDRG